MQSNESNSARVRSGVSRRTVVKGAAWAVPAIAVASAVPAMAASGRPPTVQVLEACKQPGRSCFNDFGFVKGYTFTVAISNPSDKTIYLYTATNGSFSPYFDVTSSVPFSYTTARMYYPGTPPTIGAELGSYLEVPAGQTVYIIINAGTNSNSANTDAAGTLYFAWGHTSTAGDDLDHPYTPAPPTTPTGEGWTGDDFYFESTPPCGTDCLPGGDVTPTEPVITPEG